MTFGKQLGLIFKTIVTLPLVITQIITAIPAFLALIFMFGGIMQKYVESHWQIFLLLSSIVPFLLFNWFYWGFRYLKDLYFKDLGKYIVLHLKPNGLQIVDASNTKGHVVIIRCHVDNYPEGLPYTAKAMIKYGTSIKQDEIILGNPCPSSSPFPNNALTFTKKITKEEADILSKCGKEKGYEIAIVDVNMNIQGYFKPILRHENLAIRLWE
jgi:hypothetical protein